jgi:membrane fusion protein (multidrug efflux system)
MRNSIVRWTASLLLLGCLGTLAGVWQWRAREAHRDWDPDKARQADAPIPVRTMTVDQRDLDEVIGGTAVTVASQTATVSVPAVFSESLDRQVTKVECWEGADVSRGQVLFEFDPSLIDQVVDHRRAMLAKAKQEMTAITRLWKQKAASGLQVSSAEAAVETEQLQLDLAKHDRSMCSVSSPIDGVVASVNVVPETRLRGDAALAVIYSLNPLHVTMDFPMERLDSLKVGQQAEVVLDAFPQEAFVGKVIRIAPSVSTKTRVLPVIVEIENPGNRIRAGISGFVRVQFKKKDATTVPGVAVIQKQRKAMVFCVEEGRAQIREIRTGPVTGSGHVEVIEGLVAGDEVIIHGVDSVEENDAVNVDWRQWAHRQ